MKKKVLATLMSVAMVATLIVGCGAKEAAAPADSAAPAERYKNPFTISSAAKIKAIAAIPIEL